MKHTFNYWVQNFFMRIVAPFIMEHNKKPTNISDAFDHAKTFYERIYRYERGYAGWDIWKHQPIYPKVQVQGELS